MTQPSVSPSAAPEPDRTFVFLGQRLRLLPPGEVLGCAAVFASLMGLLALFGLRVSPASVSVGFMVTCVLAAGVSLRTLRGLITVLLVAVISGYLFEAIPAAMGF